MQKYNPTLYKLLVSGNGDNLKYVEAAIFAVTVVGAGGATEKSEREVLCNSVDETLIEGGLNDFKPGEGERVKGYVCAEPGH